jgi:dTDP-glucose 4,6-dehydratase
VRHAVVTGGAGFLGSHLVDRLLGEGWRVTVLDNLVTGRMQNLSAWQGSELLRFVQQDVTEFLHVPGQVDAVLHLASPASPEDYRALPIQTLKVGSLGTHKALGLAREKQALFMLASTSEVYGDPLVHPQPEGYWGNVNPLGERGVYDEAKRFAEALALAYHRTHGVPTRIARIFNTYGPRMRPDDGRAVPTFVAQAMRGEPVTVHGDGAQTRSFGYVDDIVDGLYRLLLSDYDGPVNIGNPDEHTVRELAELVVELCGSTSPIVYTERPADDPGRRRPDIGLARDLLQWAPSVSLPEGLARTVRWFRERVDGESRAARP